MISRPGDESGPGGLEPWTLHESSLLIPVAPAGSAVPSVGLWAGPVEDPARYELLEAVGGGAEGTTFRAQYRAGSSTEPVPVAVKQLRPPPGASRLWPHDGSWQRISQQYRILAGLRQHAHLVDTREVFLGSVSTAPSEVAPFVVMEWITGRSPAEVIAEGGASLATRLRWVADLASAVRSLRSLSTHPGNAVVHGDVKPENCLVSGSGQLVLLDLGAATHAEGDARAGLHTPGYAAPEVLAAPGSPRTFAADAFSLGATAVALLTGHAPPPAGTATFAADVTEAIVQAPALGPVGSRRRRRDLAEHVLLLLDGDPAVRERHDVTRWAETLRQFGPSRSRTVRRASVAAALVTALAAGTTWVLDVPPFDGRVDAAQAGTSDEERLAAAYDDATSHVRWDLLPRDAPLADPRTQASYAFGPDSSAWPTRLPAAEVLSSTARIGYSLHITDPAVITTVTAPQTRATSREVLRTHVRIDSGQGAAGLFCRGADAAAGQRYAFMFSHAGAVGIFEPDDPGGVAGANGTGFWYLDGIDLRDGVDLQASCVDDGATVLLSLAVDGRTVLSYQPRKVLGPSSSGFEAYSFGGLADAGETVTASLSSFTQLSVS